jgi:hypothetical protein
MIRGNSRFNLFGSCKTRSRSAVSVLLRDANNLFAILQLATVLCSATKYLTKRLGLRFSNDGRASVSSMVGCQDTAWCQAVKFTGQASFRIKDTFATQPSRRAGGSPPIILFVLIRGSRKSSSGPTLPSVFSRLRWTLHEHLSPKGSNGGRDSQLRH